MNLSNVLNEFAIHMRFDHPVEVSLTFNAFDLGGNLEWNSCIFRNLNGPFRMFFRGDSPQKREILSGFWVEREFGQIQPVIDRAQPVQLRHRFALRVADGNERGFRK